MRWIYRRSFLGRRRQRGDASLAGDILHRDYPDVPSLPPSIPAHLPFHSYQQPAVNKPERTVDASAPPGS